MDFTIMLRTIPYVLRREGVNMPAVMQKEEV
jgi:hypothetical protein